MEQTKKLALGILAHVDAGKTTLAEGILYQTGQIRKAGYRGAAHWYQTPLHFYLQTPIAQIHDYSMAQFEHWTKETFSANFRKMLMLEQYRDPKLAQLHHDYLAGGPLKYMAVIFRKLADSDETAMQLALEF